MEEQGGLIGLVLNLSIYTTRSFVPFQQNTISMLCTLEAQFSIDILLAIHLSLYLHSFRFFIVQTFFKGVVSNLLTS